MKIETDSRGEVTTLRLIGRLQAEHIAALEKEIEATRADHLCLKEVCLVDIDVVRFIVECEARGILILNRSAYIREWMERERQQKD